MDILSQIMQSITSLSNRVNEIERKLNIYMSSMHETSSANIDYLALMTEIELPSEEDFNEGGNV